MRAARVINVTATGVALAALAACGAAGGVVASGDPARKAPQRSAAGPAFHTVLTTRVVSPDGQVTSLDVAGTYRPGAHPAADLTRAGGDRAAPQELRLVGDTLYVRRGAVMRPGGGGRPWLKVTRTSSSTSMTRLLAAVERARPDALLRLTGAPRGAGRHTGTFDGSAGFRRLAAADRWPARELTAYRRLSYDVRLDAAGRPSRVTLAGAAGNRRFTLTQAFDHYGTAVRVSAPPSRQVEDGEGPVLPHAPRTAQ